MKKLIAATMVAMAAICAKADTWKDTSTGYTWTYTVSGGTAQIYDDYSHSTAVSPLPTGALNIPFWLGDKRVTSIGYKALYGCDGLTSITIPSSVTNIGSYAFSGCRGLENVTIPGKVTSIGSYAFSGCRGLENVTIPRNVTSIGSYAFSDCSGLTSVTILDSMTRKSIGDRAFKGCISLSSVTIPDSVTYVGYCAFDDCNAALYDTATIPGVKLVDGWAIGNTGSLSGSLNLTGVRGIGYSAFYGCSGLTSVTIGDGVTSIGDWAFGFSRLTSVTIPDSVTSIGTNAFKGCSSLKDVIVPQCVCTNRMSYVFPDAYQSITNVIISDGVTSIGTRAFWRCSSLASVMIPDSVTSIGEHAFDSCTGLTSVVVSASVKNIEPWAFYTCRGLRSITFEGNAPEIGSGVFSGIASDGCAYVRRDSTGWGVDIPGTWNGITIDYLPEVTNQYLWALGEGNVPANIELSHYDGKIVQGNVAHDGIAAFQAQTQNEYHPYCRYSSYSKVVLVGKVAGPRRMSFWWSLTATDAYLGGASCGFLVNGSSYATMQTLNYGECDNPSAFVNVEIPEGVHTISWECSCSCTTEPHIDANEAVLIIDELVLDKVEISPPAIESKEYVGEVLKADISATERYTVQNDGGVDAGNYPVTLTLTDAVNYRWMGGDSSPTTLTFTVTKAANVWSTEPSIEGWMHGGAPNVPDLGEAKFGSATVTYGALGAAQPTEPGSYVATFAVEETDNYFGLTKEVPFEICKTDEELRLEESFDWLPATVEPDGDGGWTVMITNDIDAVDLPIELPDDIGPVTIDLNGYDLVGPDGEPAIRIVPGEGDGEATILTVITTGGDATVQGGAGAPAIEVVDGAQDGVLINLGAGVTVRGGSEDVSAIIGEIGVNEGTIIMPEAKVDFTLKVGTYFKATLTELGYDVPTNGTPYAVVAKGLPAGLKLKYNAAKTEKVKKGKKVTTVVVKKAKSEWWIEGVPTAALNFFENPPYLVITANGKTVPEPLPIEVLPQEVTALDDLALGQTLDKQFYLPNVTNGWAVSGLPTGLKYTAKPLTEKWRSGKKTIIVTNTLPYSVYGKTKKAGLFTITAKKKASGFYETMKYRVLVTPAKVDTVRFGEELTNITTMAYVPVTWDLVNGGEWDGGHAGRVTLPGISAIGGVKVAKVAGLPKGLTFAAANVYAYKNAKKKTGKYVAQPAQTIAGTPTKPGTYVVTFTKNVKEKVKGKTKTVAKTAQILWTVTANDAELSLEFNKAGGVIESGSVGLRYGDLLAFSATSNAIVKASGLPKGITLVDLGGGKWGFRGFTAAAGTYLVTVTATLKEKGKTMTQRLALRVDALPAWAKGTFNGYVAGADGTTNGLATVTVSAAGKISGKFQELGTNWTLSAASYTGAAASANGEGGYDALICSNVVAKYSYKVKSGKKTVTKYLERTFNITVSSVPVVPDVADVPVRGVVRMEEVRLAEDGSPHQTDDATEIEAWQNLWGRADYKAVGKKLFSTKSGKKTLAYKVFTIKGTDDVGKEIGLTDAMTLSLKVTAAGAVTATLTYDTGTTTKDKKTKKIVKVYYKSTCSSVVIPTSAANVESFMGNAYLYFAPAPTNNGFAGFVGWVPATSDQIGKVQLWKGGPYWATKNIGAEKPEDSGYYFWWGDTIGYKWENDAWVASDGSGVNFDFGQLGEETHPTCNKSIDTLRNEGWITADGVLASEHDAAQVQRGHNWRMPTYQELKNLCGKCDWTWTTRNGVTGYIVRGRGDYATESIFLPASGFGLGTSFRNGGSDGGYWSSAPSNNIESHYLNFFFSDSYGAGNHDTSDNYRNYGFTIRPVQRGVE